MEAVVRDLDSAPVVDAEKALLRFAEKVNRASWEIGPADIGLLHESGWTDEAIHDAILVVSLFNFYNRWVDACGVHSMSEEAYKAAARRMVEGYIRR